MKLDRKKLLEVLSIANNKNTPFLCYLYQTNWKILKERRKLK